MPKRKRSLLYPACGLCGEEGLTRTECCNKWICVDEKGCLWEHDRYSICAYHFNQGHEGHWRKCEDCKSLEEGDGEIESIGEDDDEDESSGEEEEIVEEVESCVTEQKGEDEVGSIEEEEIDCNGVKEEGVEEITINGEEENEIEEIVTNESEVGVEEIITNESEEGVEEIVTNGSEEGVEEIVTNESEEGVEEIIINGEEEVVEEIETLDEEKVEEIETLDEEENPSDEDEEEDSMLCCSLCKAPPNLTKTECCNNWICDEDNRRGRRGRPSACQWGHDRYSACAYHYKEGHEGSWRKCKECEDIGGDYEFDDDEEENLPKKRIAQDSDQ